ncbi:MAG: hypothetical protein M3067_05880 [Chloroflexota bacterium]|nr:hypothetical protein [Chloroflexota bacterium]
MASHLSSEIGTGGVGGDWFTGIYQVMLEIGMFFLLPFFLLTVVTGVLRGSWALLAQAPGYTAIAVIAAVTLPLLVQQAMLVGDGVTSVILNRIAAGNVAALLTHVGLVATEATGIGVAAILSGVGDIVFLILGGVLLLGMLLLTLELLATYAGIYLAIAAGPLALAAWVWPNTRPVLHRLLQVLVGLILVKPIVVMALSVGAAMVSASPLSTGTLGDPGGDTLLMGAVVVGLAAFAPATLFKLIPWAEHTAMTEHRRWAQGAAGAPYQEGTRRVQTLIAERFPRKAAQQATTGALSKGGGPAAIAVEGARVVVNKVGGAATAPINAGGPSGGRRRGAPIVRRQGRG